MCTSDKKKKENTEHIISNSNKPITFTKQGFNSGNNNKASILKNIRLGNKTNSRCAKARCATLQSIAY